MSHDPYSLCPCGSGKKLKFCCADILPDLIRVHRLEDNQPEAAEKALRELITRFPNREVLVGEMCRLLQQLGDFETPRQLLSDFLKKYPDHPRALVWLARLAISVDGFDASRRLLHRALQISSRSFPQEMAELVNAVGLHLATLSEYMGAREHLALAARLMGPEKGRQYLMNLAMLEADSVIPYVLRTPHALLAVSGDDETMQRDLRARKLSLIGCWEPAAILYTRATENNPQNGAIWYNLGLCRAWDGRSAEAAAALHQAATLLEDFDTAVEAEALAQVLDQQLPERRYSTIRYLLPVRSGSELLTALDDVPTFRRYDDDELNEDENESELPPGMQRVAMLDQLSQPFSDEPVTEASQLPFVISDLELLDIVDEEHAGSSGIQHPLLRITVIEDLAETALQHLRDVLGDVLLPLPEEGLDETGRPKAASVITQPKDAREFDCRLIRPADMSRSRFREITSSEPSRLAEKWMNRPVLSLGNRTPVEAAADPALKTTLAAAILTLGVNARYFDLPIDLSPLRTQLQIPEPTATVLPEGQHCAAYPAFFVQRLDCSTLDDQQLQEYCNRVSMLGFSDLAKQGLDQLLTRPSALESFGHLRSCLMRAVIARSDNDLSTLTACMQQARDAAAAGKSSFRELLEIEIRELAMRLDDPNDPELIELLHRIRDRYLSKLPEIGEIIQAQLYSANCAHLISELHSVVSVGTSSSEALWTPKGSREQGEGGGQLWLPGQDS